MSTFSDIGMLVMFGLWMANSVFVLVTTGAHRGEKVSTADPRGHGDFTARNALLGPLRDTLFFRLLFFPAVALTLLSTVLFLLSPTVSDAILPAGTAALSLQLVAARRRAIA